MDRLHKVLLVAVSGDCLAKFMKKLDEKIEEEKQREANHVRNSEDI